MAQSEMNPVLSPPKLVLLAARLASEADIDGLSSLISKHGDVLRQELVLRILLTCLPETVPSRTYVPLLQALQTGSFDQCDTADIDADHIHALTEKEAAKQVRKLHLLPLTWPEAPVPVDDDPLATFLLLRAHRVDECAGLLTQLPDLIAPFLPDAPALRPWVISVLLPLLRRSYEYYPHQGASFTLQGFRTASNTTALAHLLSSTGEREEDVHLVGRDMKGLVGPWLHAPYKWEKSPFDQSSDTATQCPALEAVLEWLLTQASKRWKVAVQVIEQWDGAQDAHLADYGDLVWTDEQLAHAQARYIRAAIASAYLITESTSDALMGAYAIASRAAAMVGAEEPPPMPWVSAINLEGFKRDREELLSVKAASYLRNDLLEESNILTHPDATTVHVLQALVNSALILTKAGVPCSIRRAGDLLLLRDARDQKAEALKFIHAIAGRTSRNDDDTWMSARRELLWLWSWEDPDSTSPSRENGGGVFGAVERQVLETEFLKALLSAMRLDLARSIYEDSEQGPLDTSVIRSTVVGAAMDAFDNASNPHRNRGGLKRCDQIIHAFPKTISKASSELKRINALLNVTHALGSYRLVLKQGEPFSPVILRIHSDPISIVEKVLEQNPKSYTRIQEFLEIGANMVHAGLYPSRLSKPTMGADEEDPLLTSQKRVTAMCIEAALREDDFETAYSYVVSRLAGVPDASSSSAKSSGAADTWSWRAALQTGQYIRTAQTMSASGHLGAAGGSPDIRHLEQRSECLATALRIAPASQLHEILKTFRRCEEQLDSAIREEAAKEAAWDAAADLQAPGAFGAPSFPSESRPHRSDGGGAARQAEDSPMSLFDLSRATAQAAQRNLGVLSSLSSSGSRTQRNEDTESNHGDAQRSRKRDQLRSAAMGTLVSGVGWLVGAPAPQGQSQT